MARSTRNFPVKMLFQLYLKCAENANGNTEQAAPAVWRRISGRPGGVMPSNATSAHRPAVLYSLNVTLRIADGHGRSAGGGGAGHIIADTFHAASLASIALLSYPTRHTRRPDRQPPHTAPDGLPPRIV
jgi:hypothetical protein